MSSSEIRKPIMAALGLACVGASACGGPVTYEFEPYEGDAFPDRAPQVSIPPDGMGIVTDSRSDTVSLIDLGTGKRFASAPVGRDPVTIDGPHHVAVDAKSGFAYVALSYPAVAGANGPHAAHGSSTVSGWAQKLRLDTFEVVGQVRGDPNPGDIVLSEDGKRLFVSNFDLQRAIANPGNLDAARSNLVLIDPTTMLLEGSPAPVRIPVCIAAHGMALSRPDAAKVYVACYGEDALAIVDAASPSHEVTYVPVGSAASPFNPAYGPYSAVMSPDGAWIVVGNTESKDVRFFEVATSSFNLDKTIKTLGAPYFSAFTADGAKLYIPMQQPDALSVIDLTTGDEIAYRDLQGACERPHVADLQGETLFLVCEGDQTTTPGSVLKMDPQTLETLHDEPVGLYPDAFVRVAGGAQ